MQKAIPALLVGIAGVVVALLWFYVWEPLALLIFLVPLAIGLVASFLVDSRLKDDDPSPLPSGSTPGESCRSRGRWRVRRQRSSWLSSSIPVTSHQ